MKDLESRIISIMCRPDIDSDDAWTEPAENQMDLEYDSIDLPKVPKTYKQVTLSHDKRKPPVTVEYIEVDKT